MLVAVANPCFGPSGNCRTLKLLSTFVMVVMPIDPRDCFLSLKVITLLRELKLLAELATLREALLSPCMSTKLLFDVELCLEDDFEVGSLLLFTSSFREFDFVLLGTE